MSKALLQEKAKSTTHGPGIYRMLDKQGKILYIGKAKNLYNRISSYFKENIEDEKTRVLVSKIMDFEVILTDSEAEALILESILIKKHKPRYNILLKDDKSYPYVVIDESHSFPKLIYTRRPKRKKQQKVFGPYASNGALREVLRFLSQSFRLRDCSDVEFMNRSRPCINYQIGICSAPCTGMITAEGYRADLEKALSVLTGKGAAVTRGLQADMDRLAENMEFEKAAIVRDQIQLIADALSTGRQNVDIASQEMRDIHRDAIGWYRQGTAATISLLLVRSGRLVDSANFHFNDVDDQNAKEILAQFISQYYLTQGQVLDEDSTSDVVIVPGTESKITPGEILLPFKIDDMDVYVDGLERLGLRMKILVPERGQKHDQVLLACKNAEHAFTERQREQGNVFRVLAELKARLRLENYPRRIECYDISNLGDTGIVASQVVFIEGKADKSHYRHYKMRHGQGQNDFASMKEVLTRRLSKLTKEHDPEDQIEHPDLIIIDGGKGQLAMAVEVIKELNITGIDVVSLAKAKTEANPHGEEIQRTFERVFKPGRMNPIALAPDSAICHLMERIRDEAHRFAVEFQRKQRSI